MKITLDNECQYPVSFKEDVGVFTSLEDARRGFREYTGFEWESQRKWKDFGAEGYSEDFGECDIFEGEVPKD